MAAADFPNSPSVGQSFTVDNKTYEWNGTYWEMAISTATIADGSIEGVKLASMSASVGDFLGWDGTEWGPESIPTINTLDDIGDVDVSMVSAGEFLSWTGSKWGNTGITLGTDTTGNFVSDIVAGTAITVTHTPGEGSSASIALNAALNDLTDTVITSPEEFQGLSYNGTSWVNSHIPLVSYVQNAEATTLTTGTVVYLFGGTGDRASVKRADNNSDTTSSKTLGVVAAPIAASQNGPVVTRGYVDGIDLSAYSTGEILWLNANGQFSTTKPTAPKHMVFVGVVVRATNNGIMYVAVQNGYELSELHDVKVNGTTDGQFLRYNSASVVWIADTINLGTDTVGDYVQNLVAGTGVTLTNNSGEGSTPTVAIGQDVATSASVSFAQLTTTGDVTVGGSLTVNGTTTTLNTETLSIEDNIIVLNSNVSASPVLNAGIEVERGTQTNVQIRWNEATDKWQFTNDGSTYSDFGSGGGVTVSSTEPVSPQSGDLWFDSDTAQTFVYYDSSWVEVGAVSGTASLLISATAPATPAEGDLWFDSDTGATYVYYSSSWIEVGAAPFDALVNRFDAKGDLLVGLADNSLTTLPVGQDGYFLQANSSASAGVQWTSVSTDFMTSTKNAAIITMEIGA